VDHETKNALITILTVLAIVVIIVWGLQALDFSFAQLND
jgi:preprotein translocase subunit SecE